MGALDQGHVSAGLMFLAIGLWHLFNNIKLFCLNPNTYTSSPWFPTPKLRYLELNLIMFFASVYIIIELFVRHHLYFRDYDHYSMCISFLVYAVFALVLDQARPRSPAAEGLTSLVLASSFTQELLLFHFHSADHMGVEGHYHLILQFIIIVSLLTTLLGIGLPKSFLVNLVKSSSIVLQGVWFIVIGYMLYTPSLIPKACFHHEEEGNQVVKCSTEEALHRAKSLINIEFSWLFVTNTIFVVILYMILDRVYRENVEYSSVTTSYQTEQDNEEQQHLQKTSFVQMGKLGGHEQKV